MTKNIILAASLSTLILAGCGSAPIKEPETKAPLTAFDYFDMAAKQYQLAETTNKVAPLFLSEILFKKSLSMQPDNINIQQAHYETLAWASLSKQNYSEADIVAAYDALHPAIRKNAVAPAKITYARESNTATPKELIPILTRAIKQKPRDSHTWKELSEVFAETDNNWMAMATAEQAVQYNPESSENNQRLAYAINGIIEENSCHFDQKALIKRSAYYGAKAATLDKENEQVSGLVGLQYTRLGLHPLALKFATKAYEQTPDAWHGSLLIDTYINLRKYQEASELALSLLQAEADYAEPYRDFALYHASNGNWAKASENYSQLADSSPSNLYYHLVNHWLNSMKNGTPTPIALGAVEAGTDWEQNIADYLKLNTPPETLVSLATDSCERADAHFYTAMRYWHEDNTEMAKKHLKLTRKQGATWFQEHFWADVLLKAL